MHDAPSSFGIRLIRSDELAEAMGYEGVNNAFRDWCAKLRITPVPGRRGIYDPVLVRRRLDEAQGLAVEGVAPSHAPMSAVEKRRARRGEG